MASATTIKEIAEMAGVSKTTVSLVLNGKADRISAVTAQKVRRIAEESGYITNALSRGLFMRQSECYGLIIPDISNPFFTGIIRGAEDRAKMSGVSLVYGSADDLIEREDTLIKTFIHKRFEGLIISHASERDKLSPILSNINVPLVLIDRDTDSTDVLSRVLSDNKGGAISAVNHLIYSGRRNIICFTGPLTTQTAKDRRDGYLECMQKAGLEVNNDMIFQGDFSVGAGQLMALALINSKTPFDAVFCCNDLIAIGAMRKFMEMGYAVPEDVAITGFDDSDISSLITPQLTTVHQATYEMGYTAVDCLVRAKQIMHDKTKKRAPYRRRAANVDELSANYSIKTDNDENSSDPSQSADKHIGRQANGSNANKAEADYATNAYDEAAVSSNNYSGLNSSNSDPYRESQNGLQNGDSDNPEGGAAQAPVRGRRNKAMLKNSKLKGFNNATDLKNMDFKGKEVNFIRDYSHPSPIGKVYTGKPGAGKATRCYDFNPFVSHYPGLGNMPFPEYIVLNTELIVRESS